MKRILILFCFIPALVLGAPQKLPITLQANKIIADQKNGVMTYIGNVVIKQGSMILRADKARVTGKPGNPEHISAWGSLLHIQHVLDGELVHAWARRAEHKINSNIIDLYNDAKIHQGKDTLKAQHIRYDINKEKVIAETRDGRAPVRAILFPRKNTDKGAS
ncbi:MAG: lipopolysaccharide ABC transporter substrate-binding protein LptA [Gammaproteobacteria bacterium]|nr:MAG: lipopolysaccharide ABC transporter substrate-binding protein LptA [Gammaproteobacteria bacterium]